MYANHQQAQMSQQSVPAANSTLLSVIACAANSSGVATNEVTPRTPEIVNSLIAMTNPFDSGFNNRSVNSSSRREQPESNNNNHENCNGNGNHGFGTMRDRADSSSSGDQTCSPPSIQHTCSQLIKEGLKLTLQTKRRVNGVYYGADESKKRTRSRREDGSADDEEDDEFSNTKSIHGLTPEDEERRRRRRERNKIAATKCRLKKREKTVILVQESESLESQNHELKSQIQELETQRRRLVDMLNLHGPNCIKQPPTATDSSYQQHQQHQDQYPQDPATDPLSGPLPSCYQENYVPSLQQHHQHPDYHHPGSNSVPPNIKVEGFDQVQPDYFRAPTTTA